MTQTVTLELPEELARNAKAVATHSQRRLEDVLIEWIDYAASELPVDHLSGEQILLLCELQLSADLQTELSKLLARNREGVLTKQAQIRLDEIMGFYRRGLIRKAQALKVAVERGLRAPLH